MLDKQFDLLRDELRGIWRYRRTAMVVAWAVASAGWLSTLLMRDVYEARARVFVETSTELRPLLQGLAIETDVQSKLDLVRQALTSQPSLQRIATAFNFSDKIESTADREDVLEEIRKRIDLAVEVPRGGGSYLYTLTYQDEDRERSVKVVTMLLDEFVEDVLHNKKTDQENAQKFLTQQIADVERRLSEAESRLAEFKKRNLGLVPGQQGDYFARLQAETDGVERVQAQLAVAESRRRELQQQLRGEAPYVPVGETATPVPRAAAGVALDTGARLQEAEARLQELLLKYTDQHPEVVATRQTIADLKSRQEREIADLREGKIAGSTSSAFLNPVRQRIQVALNEIEVEIAALRGEIGQRRSRAAELRRLADTAPEVEAEYARLNRDYGVTHAQYQSMVERLEKARLSDKADETGVVKFNVIDPPHAKYDPVAPKRTLLVVLALLAGLGAGVGVAYALHLITPVFQRARALAESVRLPVLGTIEFMSHPAAVAARRAEARTVMVSAGLLFATCVAFAILDGKFAHWISRVTA